MWRRKGGVAIRNPQNRITTPATSVTAKAVSLPSRPARVPLADRTIVPAGDDDVAEGQPSRWSGVAARSRTGTAVPPEAPGRPQRAGDDDEGRHAGADRGQDAGERIEQLSALGQLVDGQGGPHGRHDHHPGGEAGHQHQTPPDAIGQPAPGQQVDGSEGEPRHVEDGAEQVEGPEAAAGPSARLGHPEGGGRGREHDQRDRPRQLVRPAAEQPSLEGGGGEGGGDERRRGRQRGVDGHGCRPRPVTGASTVRSPFAAA